MRFPLYVKRCRRLLSRCLPVEITLFCVLLPGSLAAAGQGPSGKSSCYPEFKQRVEKALQTETDPAEITRILRASLPFSQQMVRDAFRAFPAAESAGDHQESAALRKKLVRLQNAWEPAFPSIPIPAPLPKALDWSAELCRRYAAAQKSTEDARGVYSRGDFHRARSMWQGALRIYEQLGARFAASYLYMNLGLCDYEFGEMKKAQTLLLKAQAIHEHYRHSEGLRDTLMNLSMVAEMQSRYPEARKLLLEAQRLNAALCDDKTEARILSSLGVIAKESGNLSEAERYYLLALEYRSAGKDLDGVATDANNLGVILDQRGMYSAAAERFNQALRLRRDSGDKAGEADSLLGLAEAFAGMGNSTASMKHFIEATAIYRDLGSPHRIIEAWNQIGKFYLQQGDYSKAEYYARGGLALAEKHGMLASAADLRVDLAMARAHLGDLTQAKRLLGQALDLQRQMGNSSAICRTLVELGNLGRKEGAEVDGASILIQAQQCAMEQGLAEDYIRSSILLGQVALDSGRPNVAEQYFAAAARLAAQRQLIARQWQALEGLSDSYRAAERHAAARWHLQQALSLSLLMENEISSASLATHYWDEKAALFRQMSRMAEQVGSHVSAWAWADLMKARLVKRRNSALAIPEQPASAWPAGAPGNTARIELRELYRRLSQTSEEEVVRRAELQSRIESLEAAQPTSWLPVHSMVGIPGIPEPESSLRKVQCRLQDSEVLLDFLVHPESLRAWIITRASFQTLEIAVTEKELRALMGAAGLEVDPASAVRKTPDRSTNALVDQRILRQLGERIWKPVARSLPRQARTLVIVPDGSLHLLPFEILPQINPPELSAGDRPSRYLLHDYAVSYLPAATLIEPEVSVPDRSQLKVVALDPGTGNPPTPNSSETYGAIEARLNEPHDPQGSRIGGEVEALRQLFPTARAFSWPDHRTRDQFLGAAGTSDLLHIASHYRYDPQRPELSRFSLNLAADGRNAAEPLYAFEVASLKFSSALTVLSACSTGRGELHPGEGLANMGRALLLAGSRSVITSMWPVEEESTAALMRNFYQLLAAGLDTRESLRQAKLRVIQTPRWRHPFYWGAFTLSGPAVRISPAANSRFPAGHAPLESSATVLSLAAAAGVLKLRRMRRQYRRHGPQGKTGGIPNNNR